MKRAGGSVCLLLLAFLAGCALGKTVEQTKQSVIIADKVATGGETVQPKVPVVEVWPSVVRLDDGRQGFVIKEKPNVPEEWSDDFEKAVARMQHEEYPEAIELLEKVVVRAPGVTAPYINLGICYGKTGKNDLAEQNLKTALELIPGHPVASNVYGLLLRKNGRFPEARDIYEKSLAEFPEYLPVHRNLGILCDIYLGDPDCALEQFEMYSAAQPEDEKVRIWVAELRIRLGIGE